MQYDIFIIVYSVIPILFDCKLCDRVKRSINDSLDMKKRYVPTTTGMNNTSILCILLYLENLRHISNITQCTNQESLCGVSKSANPVSGYIGPARVYPQCLAALRTPVVQRFLSTGLLRLCVRGNSCEHTKGRYSPEAQRRPLAASARRGAVFDRHPRPARYRRSTGAR